MFLFISIGQSLLFGLNGRKPKRKKIKGAYVREQRSIEMDTDMEVR